MKKLICLTAITVLFSCMQVYCTNIFAAEKEDNTNLESCTIYVDNVPVEFYDAQPYIDENDRIQTPIRAVAEAVGATVKWSENDRKILVIDDESNVMVIYAGSDVVFQNGRKIQMDTTARIENDRAYVPIRFIGEGMSYAVSADENLTSVHLTKKEKDSSFVTVEEVMESQQRIWDDSGAYYCKSQLFVGDDTVSADGYFENKAESQTFEGLSYEEMAHDGFDHYSVGNTVYCEHISNNGSWVYLSHILHNMTDDIMVEFIPYDNSKGECILTLYKNYYTIAADEASTDIAKKNVPADKRCIVKISGIYNDNILAPFLGVENENGFYLSFLPMTDETNLSGTIRITSAQ